MTISSRTEKRLLFFTIFGDLGYQLGKGRLSLQVDIALQKINYFSGIMAILILISKMVVKGSCRWNLSSGNLCAFIFDNFHLQDPSTIIQSSVMPTKS
jgi:hypothetical protein